MARRRVLTPSVMNGSSVDSGKAYIYVIRDPRTHSIVYVGSTVNPHQRFLMHRSSQSCPAMTAWLKEIKRLHLQPIFVIIQVVPEADRFIIEKRWGRRLIRQGHHILLNGEHRWKNRQCRRCSHRWASNHEICSCPKCWSTNNYFVILGPQLILFP